MSFRDILTIIIVLFIIVIVVYSLYPRVPEFFEAAANCPGNCRDTCLFSETEFDDKGYCENDDSKPNTCCILNTSAFI